MVLGLLAFFAVAAPASAIENKTFTPPVTDSPPAGTPSNVDASQIIIDDKTGITTARGHVHVTYGPYTLDADEVQVNNKTGRFRARGHVVVREPHGNVLLANDLDMQNHFRDGLLHHVKMLLTNNATITGMTVERKPNQITYSKAIYTACKDCVTDSGNPVWEIDSDRTIHDTAKHNLYHWKPTLKIDGHEIVQLPYLAMPDQSVTRRSGWLLPTINAAPATYGYGVTTPYFWALTPSTDLTLSPTWTTNEGPVADATWRQATENGMYSLRGIGVYQFNNLPAPENGTLRGAVMSNGKFNEGLNWTYGWDGTFASNSTFLGSYNLDSRLYAVNDTFATGVWDQTYMTAKMFNFGSLSTSLDPNAMPYAMPYVAGETIYRDAPLGGQVDLSWNAYSLHRTTTVTPFTSTVAPVYNSGINQGLDQTRAMAQVNWHRQFYGNIGTVFTPFANLRSDMWVTNNVPDTSSGSGFTSQTTARALPEGGFDMRWPFAANTALGQSVFSPVFQVVASANEGALNGLGNEDSVTVNLDHTSMFLADRFTGYDRYEGGTRADFGLTYALFANNGGLVRASLGQSLHLAGQNSLIDGSAPTDNRSDVVAALLYQPTNVLTFSYEGRIKNDFSAFNRQEITAGLNLDRFTTSVSYLNFAPQSEFSQPNQVNWIAADAKLGLGKGWSAFGGMTYDFTSGIYARQTAGFEFDCKCMNFKLYYARTQDTVTLGVNNSLMMSVEFATLGKTGFNFGF